MALLPEVSKNDMDMLFLSMSPSELNLLKLIVEQHPTKDTPVSVAIEDYLALEGVNIDTLTQLNGDSDDEATDAYLDEAMATAKKIFERHFKYRQGKTLVYAALLSSLSCHPDTNKIEVICSDSFYKALTCVGFDAIAAMLDTYAKPPISQLARAYSAKLYVLLTQRQVGNKNICIDYNDLREELCIDEESYSLIQNFKRRVLDLAVSDINEFTLLNVSYNDVRDGRKITHFDFTVSQKTDAP